MLNAEKEPHHHSKQLYFGMYWVSTIKLVLAKNTLTYDECGVLVCDLAMIASCLWKIWPISDRAISIY